MLDMVPTKRGRQMAKFAITYNSARKPHNAVGHAFEDLIQAQAAYTKLKNTDGIGDLQMTGAETVLEAYATKGGTVLALVKDETGYFRTDVWRDTPAGLYVETVTLHTPKNKRLATSQLMPTFAGLCAAEHAINASFAKKVA